jgi:hypothetical protein
MATEDAVGKDEESQAEVDAVLAETGRSMDQVRRWRREGLLPEVVQDQQAYRGSVVLYPKGTCAQIRVSSALFKQKNRVDYVGVRLWRLSAQTRRRPAGDRRAAPTFGAPLSVIVLELRGAISGKLSAGLATGRSR